MKLTRSNVRITIDRLLPDRPVRRRVRGIDMVLPRRHLLPYMATPGSPYAQNLVDLAAQLRKTTDDLVVLDVGANVGDTALLIHDQVPCRIVCVDGDPQWLTYLEQNVGHLPNIAVEPVLVSAGDEQQVMSIVHADVGTSRMRPATTGEGVAAVPLEELISRRPELAKVRLVKSDTDGYDVGLAIAYARAFAASRPVIFFEYDPRNTRMATPDVDPAEVWDKLADLGYEQAVVWTNGGHVLGSYPVRELTRRSVALDGDPDDRGYHFWDVAVAHRDDVDGLSVLETVAAQGVQWPVAGRP